jgi:4-amino-4-deoxy-L-arabinose transferase-like glycosyltransferase
MRFHLTPVDDTAYSPSLLDGDVSAKPGAGEASRGGPARSPRDIRAWLVFAFIAALYIGACCAPVIFDDNEGLYAGAVREMHASGNWLVPTVDGFPRVQKPPLVYWTMLVSTSVLGENEFALRLPNALATIGWIFAIYLIARRISGERTALGAAMVLASMLGVWIFNHLVQPEPFLACFVSLAIWCLVEARVTARPLHTLPNLWTERFPGDRWYLRFWIFLALGAMSKGLHGALWPLGTALLAAIFVPRLRPWLRPIFSLRGIVVFFALLSPWYVYMSLKFPGFFAAHFINEQIGASLNTRYPSDARQLPLIQFYAQHLLFWMPWTLLFPAAIYLAFKARGAQLSNDRVDLVKLLGCWFALTQVSVAFSTRQDYYSMTCWGVVALFLAGPWTVSRRAQRTLPSAFLLVPCLLVLLGGVAALGLVAWVAPSLSQVGQATASPIRDRDTFMDAIAGISPGLWAHFLVLLGIFGVTMLAAGLVATICVRRRRNFTALAVLSGAMGVPVILATAGFAMMSPYFSLAPQAAYINQRMVAAPDAIVACEALPHTASSLLYYLNARVHWVNAPFDQQYPQRVLGLGRDYFWDDAGLLQAWNSGRPLFLIVEQERLAHWQAVLPTVHVVDQAGTRLVLSNR